MTCLVMPGLFMIKNTRKIASLLEGVPRFRLAPGQASQRLKDLQRDTLKRDNPDLEADQDQRVAERAAVKEGGMIEKKINKKTGASIKLKERMITE